MVPEKAQFYIDSLNMSAHPEGGWYKETYRSSGSIPGGVLDHTDGDRSFCTAIYFLLTRENFSAFHRIKSDEMWHFYDGDGLIIHELTADGSYLRHGLGLGLNEGEGPQLVIAAGSWFASEVPETGNWCLVGCTVSPGFDFDDFELAQQGPLIEEFPEHGQLISRLTRT